MDNNQMPPVQPMQPNAASASGGAGVPGGAVTNVATGVPTGAVAGMAGGVPTNVPTSVPTNVPTSVPTSAQMVAAAAEAMKPKKNIAPIILGVLLAIFVILAGTFIALYVMKNADYDELSTDVDLKIEAAVSEAKTEQALEDAEEAKKDTRQFTGPTDYGQLSFDYPKLWSLYVASDASKGGDFVAYFNPIEIEPVSDSTVYALRLTIRDKSSESVIAEYQKYLDKGELSMETITVDSVTANRYTGKIPGTELNGVIVIFKIRDKTAVLRTDSVLYEKDFDTVLATVKFNQ